MNKSLNSFKKQHKHIICLDSDGTVLDAMNVKHRKCHGPAFIEVWGLEGHGEEVQEIWNRINLYDRTRGINRFLALLEIIKELNGRLMKLSPEDIQILENWVLNSTDLSSKGLKNEIKKNASEILKKTLEWSDLINAKISALSPVDKPPFPGVIDFLKEASKKADHAIVSSSNIAALEEEWGYYGLLDYVDLVTSQETGTKTDCLRAIIEKGYSEKRVLMVGDALPDVVAAKVNGVFFYPILINNEEKSWKDLKDKFLQAFLEDRFELYQDELLTCFNNNFTSINDG